LFREQAYLNKKRWKQNKRHGQKAKHNGKKTPVTKCNVGAITTPEQSKQTHASKCENKPCNKTYLIEPIKEHKQS